MITTGGFYFLLDESLLVEEVNARGEIIFYMLQGTIGINFIGIFAFQISEIRRKIRERKEKAEKRAEAVYQLGDLNSVVENAAPRHLIQNFFPQTLEKKKITIKLGESNIADQNTSSHKSLQERETPLFFKKDKPPSLASKFSSALLGKTSNQSPARTSSRLSAAPSQRKIETQT
jgi:hypothetical protein